MGEVLTKMVPIALPPHLLTFILKALDSPRYRAASWNSNFSASNQRRKDAAIGRDVGLDPRPENSGGCTRQDSDYEP